MDIDLFMLQFPFGLKPDETMYVIGNGTALVTRGGATQVYPATDKSHRVNVVSVQGPLSKDKLECWLRDNVE